MKREEVHRAWAPDDGAWSSWVKPVLFAHMPEDVWPSSSGPKVSWSVPTLLKPLGSTRDVAAMLDLPGAEAVAAGLALAAHGFRPIPLFNALPHQHGFVDQGQIVRALIDAANAVAALPVWAPPAFLLDSERMVCQRREGFHAAFDNRWVVRANDVPSAGWLRGNGIERVLLLQPTLKRALPDFEPILLAWQSAGLELWRAAVQPAVPCEPYRLVPRTWFERVSNWLSMPQLRRNPPGAFGGVWLHGG